MRPRTLALLLATALFASAPVARAQQSPPQSAPASKPAIEAKAVDVLKATSERLAAARTLSFTAVVSYESPSRIGPALVYTTRSDVTVQRPDKLRVLTPGDGPASEFYYDGKTMMAFAPAENLVAVADAPPTLDAMLEHAYHTAAIYFPFTDAIVANPMEDIAKSLELAFYIGQSSVVGGVKTDMVAYAAHGVFVQLWVGADDKLPRLARAVFRNDPQRLRHQVEFTGWRLGEPVAPEAFASARAAQARRIPFAHPDPAPAAPTSQGQPPSMK